ncbi:MAG: hypothetical protein WBB01_05825 [Phormidesmis sp.]
MTTDMTDENTLWIVADAEVVEETVEIDGRRSGGDTGGGFGPPRRVFEAEKTVGRRSRLPISADKVKAQMQSMIAIVNDLFDQATPRPGLRLNEVELSVEINAEGKVSLIGSGGKFGSKGGITLKFVRPPE